MMEWIQVLTIILSVAGLFLWTNGKIDRLSENVMKEIKDFHGRLCSLEEKYKQFEVRKIIKKEKE